VQKKRLCGGREYVLTLTRPDDGWIRPEHLQRGSLSRAVCPKIRQLRLAEFERKLVLPLSGRYGAKVERVP